MSQPVVDPSWHRVSKDTFAVRPSVHTPLDPSSSTSQEPADEADDSGSDWSFSDVEELVVVDLGEEHIARRALLGYSAGFGAEADLGPSTTSRAVRGARGADTDKRTKRTTSTPSTNARRTASGPHLGAGKQLAITGLDTSHPLLKIDDTVLRGRRMDMLGSEIVLADHFDPTRSDQHRLQPLPPGDGSRATTRSSTTRTRLVFRPIYDPEQRESTDNENYAPLRNLVRTEKHHVPTPAAANEELKILAKRQDQKEEPSTKRKELSESEQLIRKAERSVRKAAKLLRQEQRHSAAADSAAAESSQPDQPPEPSSPDQSSCPP